MLKKLDIFRKTPEDLIHSTYSGATISVISFIIIASLFVIQFLQYSQYNVQSEMFIDINRGGQNLQINLDIYFPRLPCDLISLDVQDVMGTHTLNIDGRLKKNRIINNEIIAIEDHTNQEHNHEESKETNVEIDFERAREAFNNKEGCQLVGYIIVKKVPGNFHISAHPFESVLEKILPFVGLSTLDLSHKINHLSFGDQSDLGKIRTIFQDSGVLNPLDNLERMKNQELKHVGVLHQYYISIVPTTYIDINNKEYFVHQFSANSNEVQTQFMPVVYFRYDFSPVTVQYTQYKQDFFHFIVQICAIVGGVFTVAGIFDSLVYQGVRKLIKKSNEGKLS